MAVLLIFQVKMNRIHPFTTRQADLNLHAMNEKRSRLSLLLRLSMVELLILQGNCSPFRSKSAHSSGHLPDAFDHSQNEQPLKFFQSMREKDHNQPSDSH